MTRPTGRAAFGSLMLLLWGAAGAALGQQPAPQDKAAPAAAPQTESPIERLLREGGVEVKYYDPREQPREFPGWTEFSFDVRHKYSYEYEVRRRGRMNRVAVRIKMAAPEFSKRHVVNLPKSVDGRKPWSAALSRHELDHVAISSDPRAEMLLAHLLRNLTRLDRDFEVSERIDDELLQKAIDDELAARRKALIAVVNAHYRLLDRLTRHGVDPLPERDEFFAWLYSKPGLDQAEFAYAGDVLDLLKSEAYQKLSPTYLKDNEELKP